MKLDKSMCKLIGDIEFLIGSECYNPNSYDGWNDIEGCDFRYPLIFPMGNNKYAKVRYSINQLIEVSEDDITPENIKYMKYKFGSNELFIGIGIIKTLQYLEERYGLNFNKLEQNCKNNSNPN